MAVEEASRQTKLIDDIKYKMRAVCGSPIAVSTSLAALTRHWMDPSALYPTALDAALGPALHAAPAEHASAEVFLGDSASTSCPAQKPTFFQTSSAFAFLFL